ncbi:ROK family transcriptional regulator [Sulfobacillus thermosulfidooxidans]|uniref:ROK family transcriptional regulator n=1 Tax=Sulfobacillus thermosulfidooxidans TaxID=28034 RepID=UPI00096B8188|nr:ROK family transcriptional regulator [Sulfobacillus thermosulfidooxidans]OLZ10507.1 glucokinase [Sulfobacillus thermosulfidooxidans]OLZ14237.1 glucokinase [Sulfobacillus thermosulfidooxidans]OLZ18980.1 glucokinase [Sulfobacillus thermosulfidooxidans]
MRINIDAQRMRQLNKYTVLHWIYNHPNVSRADIAKLTGLNRATVSSLVDELLAEDFIQELGQGTSSGGRKPIILQFNARTGFSIGVDVQISSIKTLLTDARGQVVDKKITTLRPPSDGSFREIMLQIIEEHVREILRTCPPSSHGIFGVGIALPGMVDYSRGHVYYLPNVNVENWNFTQALASRINLPVVIDNDANCGAWAEFLRHPTDSLVFINAGIGVGAGLILHGQLVRGRHGIAGEWGHTTISATGLLCACGNYGCWELYSSERALARYLHEEGVSETDPFIPSFIERVLAQTPHDIRYQRAFSQLGAYLGIGISNILNAFNPRFISIGGTISQAAHWLLPEIHRMLKKRAIGANKQIGVFAADLDMVAIGAAGLVLSRVLPLTPLPSFNTLNIDQVPHDLPRLLANSESN